MNILNMKFQTLIVDLSGILVAQDSFNLTIISSVKLELNPTFGGKTFSLLHLSEEK